MRTNRRLLTLLLCGAVLLGACAAEDEPSATTAAPDGTAASTSTTAAASDGNTLRVPADHETIQAAVDAAEPGDLILVAPGTYNEAVDVTTDDLVIRGEDRNTVILDGEFELENGIRVITANGVAIENMTAQNYTRNGFFWTTDIEGYRASYLTALRNGDYGIYTFGARNGLIEHSYAAGSPDAGFYIGQCFPCNALIIDVVSEYNGLGYSGTNAGGDLYIVNSIWRHNRAGIVPNSGSYEGCAPERESTIVGNLVYSNSNGATPAIGAARDAQGNGIIVPGGLDNVIERNRIHDHDVAGIALVPFPEDNPIDAIPDPPSEDCLADATVAEPDVAATLPELLLWPATGNIVRGNVITDSRVADMLAAIVADELNFFCDNEHETTLPEGIEETWPCEGEPGTMTPEGTTKMLALIEEERPESVPYEEAEWPHPGDQENMPDALTAPRVSALDYMPDVDLESIEVPELPEDLG
jgi:hypothetical protein